MPSRRFLALALVLGLSSLAAAAPQLVPLDPTRPDAAPVTVQVTSERPDGLSLTLDLGALQHETVTLGGRDWTALLLPDGAIEGDAGRPGLPVWTGLVVLPTGATGTASARAVTNRRVTDLDLMPVQPDDADGFVVDASWYAAGGAEIPALVTLGEPASLAGQTVAPLVVRPVSYDAGGRTATVATRVTVELDWTAAASAAPTAPVRQAPASMRRLLADLVVNPPAALDSPTVNDVPGTWLVITPDNASVRAAVEPLADWRRQQGFNVVMADLGDTGSSTTSIKNWLRDQYAALDPPLEYVVLVGDANGTIAVPTWNETISGYYGEGDFYYTQLDGDDILPDVHLGRLSCRSVAELQGIVTKIIGYETAPPMADTGWFTRALVVGDPSDSGMTTVYCGEWLADQLADHGYGPITEVYSGNFASQMLNSLNQGQSIFGYRGFAGMSGFSASHAQYLNNGLALPFACIPTCLTGSFKSDYICRSEAFLANANGGAIGAIGTATGGTHTRYNNCFYHGVFEGMVNSGDHHQGSALTRGKLELYSNYWVNEPGTVEIWSVWNNLMGDPATDVWSSVPASVQVTHPWAIPAAATALPVEVTAGLSPVGGARVTLVQDEILVAVGLTDATGRVTLPLPGGSTSPVTVTVTGHGLLPYDAAIAVAEQTIWVSLDQWQLDDTGGNGDGLPGPGESLEVQLTLRNLGTATATGVTVTAVSESEWLTVTQPGASFGTIAAGATAAGDRAIRLAVAADAPDEAPCALRLEVTGDQGAWASRLELPLVGSRLEPAGIVFSGGQPLPGTSGELVVTLDNAGALDCPGATAVLRARSPWVAIGDSLGTWGALPAGGGGDNEADPFGVAFTQDCARGHLAPFTLVVTQHDGAVRRVDFTVAVGVMGVVDPTGPDRYGYLAFDSGDTEYDLAPVYDWIEIDPNHGGQGTDVGLSDWGYEQDDTETVDLPFTFRYYGRDYDQLSICSNGWVALGETDLRHYRNWTLPAAGTPDAMIAVFWDDLKQSGSNRVYRWHDAANHRYIVQWSRMTNYYGGLQNCEVILHDPVHHPTTSGDGAVVCQYHTVDNNDYSRGYATAGIQDHTRTDGLVYTYYADYAPGAARLEAGMAVAYLPATVLSVATCDVTPAELSFVVPLNGQQSQPLGIANNGPAGSALHFSVEQADPAVSALGGKSLDGSTFTIAEPGYVPDTEVTLHVSVHNGSPDAEYIVEAELELPPGVTLVSASNLVSSGGTLSWDGATGDGADARWSGSGGNVIHQGHTAEATVVIDVEVGLGDLELPWALVGDFYGSPPHMISGTLPLICLVETVRVVAPDGGDLWSEGEQCAIEWYMSDDIAAVDVELTRDGTSWQTLASGVPAPLTGLDWTVTGPVSNQCRVRVTAVGDPSITDTSDGNFTIQHDLGWLDLDAWSGVVAAGQTADLEVTVDAAGLPQGVYEQLLVIANNAGVAVIVPVTLTVGDITPVDDLPRTVALAQNHPNPFNPTTRIEFALPASGPVDLAVYDLSGRRVATLVSGEREAGRHAVVWQAADDHGRPLPSGTYLYRLRTNTSTEVNKLSVVK